MCDRYPLSDLLNDNPPPAQIILPIHQKTKKTPMLRYILQSCSFLKVLLAITLTMGGLHAAPYGPEGKSIEWVQPDKTKLKLLVKGDFNYARTVTTEGYTVVYNPTDQTYYYAKLNKKQDEFIPMNQKLGENPPKELEKNIQLSAQARKRIFNERNQKFNAERLTR